MGIPLPALDVRPIQQPNPLDEYAKAISIRSMQNQQQLQPGQVQLQQQAVQEGALRLAQSKAMQDAYSNAVQVDPATGKATFNQDKALQGIMGTPASINIPEVNKSFLAMDQARETYKETQLKNAQARQDYAGEAASMVKAAGYTPEAFAASMGHLSEVDPQGAQRALAQVGKDPTKIQPMMDQILAGSSKQQEIAANVLRAQNIAKQPPEGQQPVDPQAMTAWNQALGVIDPQGKMPMLKLQPGATQADLANVRGVAEFQAKAAETAGQNQIANGIRQQLLNLQQQKNTESQQAFIPSVQQGVVQNSATQDRVRDLLKTLEPLKGNNTPFNSLGPAVLYKIGVSSSDDLGKRLAEINLTDLQQAGAVMKQMGGVRAWRMIDAALQHTPDPMKDSPMLMYNKLKNIDESISVWMQEADKYGRKAPTAIEPEMMKPYGVTPPAANVPRGMPQAAGAGVIFARDQQGVLHQAPAGTPLPQGWKEETK